MYIKTNTFPKKNVKTLFSFGSAIIFSFFLVLASSSTIFAAEETDSISATYSNGNKATKTLKLWSEERCISESQSGSFDDGNSKRSSCKFGYIYGFNQAGRELCDLAFSGELEQSCNAGYDAGALLASSDTRRFNDSDKVTIPPSSPNAGTKTLGQWAEEACTVFNYVQNDKKIICKDGFFNGFNDKLMGRVNREESCKGSSDQDVCKKAYDSGAALAIESENAAPQAATAGINEPDCDPAFGLGWIACASSEFMANFASDVFEKILGPMLENVPVSLNRAGPESGAFKAWQNFRVIANVLLVISLLAVVYSQARGGE